MSELRLNPLTGRWVTIASERAARPDEFPSTSLEVEADLGRPCPFCPGHELENPSVSECVDDDGDWRVRVVPNLFPAFSGDRLLTVNQPGPAVPPGAASGIHEVLVLTPEHAPSFADLDDDQIELGHARHAGPTGGPRRPRPGPLHARPS